MKLSTELSTPKDASMTITFRRDEEAKAERTLAELVAKGYINLHSEEALTYSLASSTNSEDGGETIERMQEDYALAVVVAITSVWSDDITALIESQRCKQEVTAITTMARVLK